MQEAKRAKVVCVIDRLVCIVAWPSNNVGVSLWRMRELTTNTKRGGGETTKLTSVGAINTSWSSSEA